MSPRCLLGVSQMSIRCLPDVVQMSPRSVAAREFKNPCPHRSHTPDNPPNPPRQEKSIQYIQCLLCQQGTVSSVHREQGLVSQQATMSGLPTGIMKQTAGAEKSSDHETARNVTFDNSPKCNLALVRKNSMKIKWVYIPWHCPSV